MVYDGVIVGKTVRLRSVEERDADITFKMRSDPEKSRFFHAAKGTVEDQLNFIKKQRQKRGDYLFIIEDMNGSPIGMKGLYDYNPQKKEIESGRYVGFGSQVQNVEALMLSFDFAFEKLGVETIHMDALENNMQMLSLQKRFGVEFTGRFHEEGMEYDRICSVLTKGAYSDRRSKVEALIGRFAGR